jgi:hypothetical protein
MATRDATTIANAVVSLANAVYTTDQNGVGVDISQHEGVVVRAILGDSGATLSGTNFISLELEESDDDVTYTNVADADILGATGGGSGQFGLVNAPTEDLGVISAGYRGTKPYIRPVVNFEGTHGVGTPIAVIVERFWARHEGA